MLGFSLGFIFIHSLALAQEEVIVPEVLDKIQLTRAGISEDERRQREALSHLFLINKKVQGINHKQDELNQKLRAHEASVQTLAQTVAELEERMSQHKGMLNRRLRQLYQERNQDTFHWMFSAQSPVELERNHRFLRRMIDSDHQRLKQYLGGLEQLRRKRGELKGMVVRLLALQKEVHVQELALGSQLKEKSKYLTELKKSKDLKLTELKGLRDEHRELGEVLSYAFFERRGQLRAPIEGQLLRDFGAFVDPQFRFRLSHKGFFFSTERSVPVRTVFHGRVVVASALPGYGKTVIVDHGDNYYTVYAFNARLNVREGAKIAEGDVVAFSGDLSPLFGPGLYFEIRHFTDAIDPRPWIKDSNIKTADFREHP